MVGTELLEGMIQTVTGPIDSGLSGFTMPLEHLLADPTQHWTPPTDGTRTRGLLRTTVQ